MAKAAASDVYSQTGTKPEDIDVIELHDCFSCNELITYEAIGIAGEGEAHKLVDAGDNTFGGKFVVNPSGEFGRTAHDGSAIS